MIMAGPLAPEWLTARKILVMRPDNIGDVVMTGPVFRALKQSLPASQLTLLGSRAGVQAAPLLPEIDDVIESRVLWQDLGHMSFDPDREWQLVEQLRQRAFDAAIILTSFSQSPQPAAFIAQLAGIPVRLGASKERSGPELTHPVPSPPDAIHQVERNLQLIEAMGFPVGDRRLRVTIPPAAAQQAAALRREQGMDRNQPYLLLCPWASCQARTYFPQRFAQAARQLAATTGWPVVVAGGPRDVERRAEVLDGLGAAAVDLVGKTSVPELAALVDNAALVLTNDSLPMHLAAASATPAVVLYAGTELDSQWAPRYTPHRLLRQPTRCTPCYRFYCPFERACLDFTPDEVAVAGLELLDRHKPSASGRKS